MFVYVLQIYMMRGYGSMKGSVFIFSKDIKCDVKINDNNMEHN